MEQDGRELAKIGLPPVAAADARLIILGSLPGDASLAARRYYAHPTNQFWRLLGGVIGTDIAALAYDERLAAMASQGIGLWDVIGSAHRRGSLDQAIRSAEHNPLSAWLDGFPDLRAVAFNGQAASVAGRRLLGRERSRLARVDLPSSSAANTLPVAAKAERWADLRAFLID